MTEPAVPSRAEAQQRADDIRTFRDELARLTDAGVLRLGAEQHIDRDVWFPGSARKPTVPPGLGTVTIHTPRNERTRYAYALPA